MTKQYIALNSLLLTTTIQVKGKEQSITFKGGILKPTRRNGIFSTDDKELQKAIESDSEYNKSFTQLSASQNVVNKKKVRTT